MLGFGEFDDLDFVFGDTVLGTDGEEPSVASGRFGFAFGVIGIDDFQMSKCGITVFIQPGSKTEIEAPVPSSVQTPFAMRMSSGQKPYQ